MPSLQFAMSHCHEQHNCPQLCGRLSQEKQWSHRGGECWSFYVNEQVIDKGRNGYVGVGLSAPTVPLNRLPGWEPASYGYHGDDGHVFYESGRGRIYGPTFGKGTFSSIISSFPVSLADTLSPGLFEALPFSSA